MDRILQLKTSEKGNEGGDDNEATDNESGELRNEAGVDISYENRDKEKNGDDSKN